MTNVSLPPIQSPPHTVTGDYRGGWLYTVEPRYTEMRYTEYLLYRSNRLSPFFPIFKFDRYNEF